MISFGKKNKDRKQSSGEVAFDRIVYTGIGFGVNEVSSMIIADELQYGIGKKHYNALSEKLSVLYKADKIDYKGRIISKAKQAGNMLEIGALLIGGTLLVLPMKMMTDRKAEISETFNHWIDKFKGRELDGEALKARDQEVADAIACEPKQSWKSLLIGRAAAVINNMFIMSNTLFTAPTADRIKDWSETHVVDGTVKLDKLLGDKPNSPIKKMMGDLSAKFEDNRFRRYARIFSIETIYTAISSLVLEVVSKFTAGKKPEVQNPAKCKKSEAQLAAAEAETPASQPLAQEKDTGELKSDKLRGITPRKNFQDLASRASEQPMQLGA